MSRPSASSVRVAGGDVAEGLVHHASTHRRPSLPDFSFESTLTWIRDAAEGSEDRPVLTPLVLAERVVVVALALRRTVVSGRQELNRVARRVEEERDIVGRRVTVGFDRGRDGLAPR
jgi:hypothetical protein